jgi:hypothetical protein
MVEIEVDQLKRAIEAQHGCAATFVQSVPVPETVPPGITDRDVAAPSSSSPEQADQPSHALETSAD